MCLICVQYQQGKLTFTEAKSNYFEAGPTEHVIHAIRLIEDIQDLRKKTQTPNVMNTIKTKKEELDALSRFS